MSGFDTHKAIGVVVMIVGSVFVYQTALAASLGMQIAAILGGVIGFLGFLTAIFPDVDVASSIPRRLFGRVGLLIGGIVGGAAFLFIPTLRRSITNAIGNMMPSLPSPSTIALGIVTVAGLGVAVVFGRVFDEATTHRGLFHHPVFGMLLAAVTIGGLSIAGIRDRTVLLSAGVVVFLGFFAHILTDKLSS